MGLIDNDLLNASNASSNLPSSLRAVPILLYVSANSGLIDIAFL